ncbi:MAG: hypothetical protein RSF40_01410 [Oscillospiraceae bacterium]
MNVNKAIENIIGILESNKPIDKDAVLGLLHAVEDYNVNTDANHNGFSIGTFSYKLSKESLDGNDYFSGKYDEITKGISHYMSGISCAVNENLVVDAGVIYNLLCMIYSYNKELGICDSNEWMLDIFKAHK